MSDTKGSPVPMTGAGIPQHKRMAAGQPVDGKSIPAQQPNGSPKTPA